MCSPDAQPAAPLRVAFAASQDPRVAANGVNSHSRNLKAALAEAGFPFVSVLDPVAAPGGRRRLFGARVLGRLERDADGRALRDLTARHAILADGARRDRALRKADAIHAQDFIAAAACMDALGTACPPIVLAHHANGLAATELRERLALAPTAKSVEWCARTSARVFARAARVVAVSAWAADLLAAAGGVERARLAVVLNGVPVPKAPPGDGERVAGRILAVGQLVERKGLDLLVEALAALAALPEAVAPIRAHALVVGDGPVRRALEDQARRLGAPVTFKGALSADEVRTEMRRASVFVLPSRAENLPMALLEAMAAGLPAVASAVGGVAAALAAETDAPCGLVVGPGDAGALAEALGRLVREPEAAAAIGRRAHARALAVYGTETMARHWRELYEQAARESR